MWNRTYFVTSAVVSNSFHIAWKRLLSLAHFASIHFRLNFRTFAIGLVLASNSDKCRTTLSYRFTCWTAHLFSTRPSLTTICSFNDQRHSCKKCWIMKNELSVWSSIGLMSKLHNDSYVTERRLQTSFSLEEIRVLVWELLSHKAWIYSTQHVAFIHIVGSVYLCLWVLNIWIMF